MKKIVILLCIVVLSLSACSKKDTSSDSKKIDYVSEVQNESNNK